MNKESIKKDYTVKCFLTRLTYLEPGLSGMGKDNQNCNDSVAFSRHHLPTSCCYRDGVLLQHVSIAMSIRVG